VDAVYVPKISRKSRITWRTTCALIKNTFESTFVLLLYVYTCTCNVEDKHHSDTSSRATVAIRTYVATVTTYVLLPEVNYVASYVRS
jgi:hypothetical protein